MLAPATSGAALAAGGDTAPEQVGNAVPVVGGKHRAEVDKLRLEIKKLHNEVNNSSGLRGFIGQYAGVITALGALLAAGIAFVSQSRERNRLTKSDIATQQRAVEQRQAESDRDLAARFSHLLLDLGSDSEPVQAGAAISLLTFLDLRDPTFHHQVRLAVLANLKVTHPPAVTKLLRRTFERAMASPVSYDPIELDLSGTDLAEATLRDLKLEGARLDNADLRRADLTNTSLQGATGSDLKLDRVVLQGEKASLFNARLKDVEAPGARLQGSELVNAHIKRADLGVARFEGARLQAAHFKDCNLRGAHFNGANVADAYFHGCVFDDNALRTMLKATNVDKAHFDPEHLARLGEL
ncbi:MAG: pentapeptide repeat-containing protein [Solirubrobacterales bacterium]